MNGRGYGALLALGLLVCAPAAGAQEQDETALPPRVEFAEYYVLPGIDTIPNSAIRLSPAEVRQFFLVTDISEGGHARGVRNSACLSYITSVDCSEPLNPRTTPFSFLARGDYGTTKAESAANSVREIVRRGWTLVTKSSANAVGGILDQFGADLPFVLIDSAGNDSTDNFFERPGLRYDRKNDTFVPIRPVSDAREAMARNIRRAVVDQRVIFVSGYILDQGVPKRDPGFTGCRGVEESCVYQSAVPAPGRHPGLAPGGLPGLRRL